MERVKNMKNRLVIITGFALAFAANPAMAQSASGPGGVMNLGSLVNQGRVMESIVIGGGYDDDIRPGQGSAGSKAKDTGSSMSGGQNPCQDVSETGIAGAEKELTEGRDLSHESMSEDFFKDDTRHEMIVSPQLFETAGYISDSVESDGEVVDGEPSSQASFSIAETIYINQGESQGVSVGNRFLVFHSEKESVTHPVTGSNLGHKVLIDGVVEVREVTMDYSKAVIIQSYDGIERGDLIIPYTEPEVPQLDPDRPVVDKDIDGYLVASRDPKEGYASGDVVYFDIGDSAGVEPGDVFNIVDRRPVKRKDGETVVGLPKIIGTAKIISARDTTSTAYITTSRTAIYAGDRISYSKIR